MNPELIERLIKVIKKFFSKWFEWNLKRRNVVLQSTFIKNNNTTIEPYTITAIIMK